MTASGALAILGFLLFPGVPIAYALWLLWGGRSEGPSVLCRLGLHAWRPARDCSTVLAPTTFRGRLRRCARCGMLR